MTTLWYWSALRFGRTLSSIVREWIQIGEYVWVYINATYYDNVMTSLWYSSTLRFRSCFWNWIGNGKCRSLWQAFDIDRCYVSRQPCFPSSGNEYKLLSAFEFIKAVSETGLNMINAAYYEKPLIFIDATFREEHRFWQHDFTVTGVAIWRIEGMIALTFGVFWVRYSVKVRKTH